VSSASGSGLGLAVNSRSLDSVSTVLGAKVNYAVSQSWGVLSPHAEVEWEHEYEDNPDTVNARFLADPTSTVFQIKGDPVDTNFFRLGLGLSFTLPKGKSGFVYYEKTVGITGLTQDNLTLGFRMEF
jgi:outer membrane autotransporter protein